MGFGWKTPGEAAIRQKGGDIFPAGFTRVKPTCEYKLYCSSGGGERSSTSPFAPSSSRMA
jgi:hypothetical protein